jgi:hypothetical protein
MKLGAIAMVLGIASMSAAGASDTDDRIAVLILTGQNNHEWRATTPVLVSLLDETGRFRTKICETPHELTLEALARHHVVLSNWNSHGKDAAVQSWPDAAREAYVEFVRGGGGHVVVHAGSASFPDWAEYQEICLATWGDGTRHGPVHEFPLRAESVAHPVTAGMPALETTDELWIKPVRHETATVLVSSFSRADWPRGSGDWEPSAMAGGFGRGRTFTLLLGHDAPAMRRAAFRDLLVRGVEWAGSGHVTIPWTSAVSPTRSSSPPN